MTIDNKTIQKELKRRKMSFRTLAKKTGIDANTLHFYVKGKLELPSHHLKLIEAVLNQTMYLDISLVKEHTPKTFFALFTTKAWSNEKRSLIKAFSYALGELRQTHFSKIKPFFIFVIIAFIMAYLADQFALENLLFSAIVPIGLLWVIYTVSQEESIGLFQLFKLVVFGGLGSILLVYMARELIGYPTGLFGDYVTAIIEETMKLVIVIIVLKKMKIITVKTGILIGFAIGAGFDVFETADYGFAAFIENFDYLEFYSVLTFRSIFAIFGIGHHFWTALLAGTIVYLKNNETLSLKTLKEPTFIVMYIIVISLHAFWNHTSMLVESSAYLSGYALMIGSIIMGSFLFLKFFQVAHYETLYNQHYLKIVYEESPITSSTILEV